MSALALDFTYRYPSPSAIIATPQRRSLQLATCSANQTHPYFFQGRIEQPRQVADLLLALMEVVRSHYFLPRPPQTDPVVTCNEAMLRFESFSGCCGVYVRVDLEAASFAAEHQGRGTTNVDFNEPMRAALSRLQDGDRAEFSVGRDEFALSQGDAAVVEKKVRLPLRWIKGFSEVQAYLPRLTLQAEISGSELRRLVRSLPLGSPPRQTSYLVPAGAGLRLSQRPAQGAVAVQGLHRLRALNSLTPRAEGLRLWGDAASGISCWEVLFPVGRASLLLSPQTQRGFSGEGQILNQLTSEAWAAALPKVRAQLRWQNQINLAQMAGMAGLDLTETQTALAALGACGLAGFDCSTSQYFHRELPFDLERVEALQPRLLNARALLDEHKIRLLNQPGTDGYDLSVEGTETVHHVRLREALDRCSCPWFSKHLGGRGPCKHILAARLFIEQENARG